MLLTSQVEVEFREKEHQYFRFGNEYLSQSKFVKIFEPEFDKRIVKYSAAKAGVTTQEMQRQWDSKASIASSRGTLIHGVLEDSWNGLHFDPIYAPLIEQVRMLIQPSIQQLPEKIFYIDQYQIAGTADLPSIRNTYKKRQVLDIYDYKTNLAKGISFYNSRFKDSEWKHYNSWFSEPISHLEFSLYNKYALQLSLYMYMAEQSYEIIPGRMGIIWISEYLYAVYIPVPYLKFEVKAMLEFYSQLKPL